MSKLRPDPVAWSWAQSNQKLYNALISIYMRMWAVLKKEINKKKKKIKKIVKANLHFFFFF